MPWDIKNAVLAHYCENDPYSRKPKDKKILASVAFLQNTTIDFSGVSQGYNRIFCDLKIKGRVAFHIFWNCKSL